MDIVQRPHPRAFPPAIDRAARPARRGSSQSSLNVQPLPVVAGAALACLFYLWGWAQVTQANYQHVQLDRQASILRTQHQLIETELIRNKDKTAIDEWARLNGMVQAGGACIYVGSAPEGR